MAGIDTTGRKIKRMREIKGLTQKDIADSIGMSVNNYGRIERDEIEVTVERLNKIADTMGVEPEDILKLHEGFSVVINNSKDFYVAHTMQLPEISSKVFAMEERMTKLENMLQSFLDKMGK